MRLFLVMVVTPSVMPVMADTILMDEPEDYTVLIDGDGFSVDDPEIETCDNDVLAETDDHLLENSETGYKAENEFQSYTTKRANSMD